MIDRLRSRSLAGFTLVELMAVVAIVAVLAVVATFSYKRYMRRARHLEGSAFLLDLKLKQESYFMTYSRYLSSGTDENAFFPAASDFDPEKIPVPWPEWKCGVTEDLAVVRFCELGVKPQSDLTYFQYVTVGWSPGVSPPSGYIKDATRRWWIARARTYPENSDKHWMELRLTSEFSDIAEFDGP
ncbi:MAG: prepilin-type N-terminal cleavage/methylation domain-containing protein [Deltaproteobacteria bacterium]|nr:prepilin-type N-terminal cleavage/methylation domain-containing protein [Deltaproteobacteria bacterium]